MDIALVGLVVAALIIFLLTKKKAAASRNLAELEAAPFTTQSKHTEPQNKSARPTPEVETKTLHRNSDGPEQSRPGESQRSSNPSQHLGDGDDTPVTQVATYSEAPASQQDGSIHPDEYLADQPAADLHSEHPLDELTAYGGEDSASPPPPPVRGTTPSDSGLAPRSGLLSLRKGLAKSRESGGFFGKLKDVLTGRKDIDPAIAEEIEEVLLASDVGVATTEAILDRIKEQLSRGDLKNEAQVWQALREQARRTLSVEGRSGAVSLREQPTVILLVGVNGAGKTTTIGKLAAQFSHAGKKVVLAAGDTFRAAAVDQLRAWGDRVGCEVIFGKDGADPSSVLFDAVATAKATGADVILADTAGRLHTKTNLMQEMTKIQKTIGKALPGAPHEILLVIDATNGQNAMAQAREFKEALDLSGLILTKLDGTARGGVVLGICGQLQLPIRYVGVGEKTEHLYEFNPEAFVEALLGADNEAIPS